MGPVDRAIADHVARLIPDRATIELGLGAIPEAVTRALGRKQGLGFHSGAIGDGIADLMEAGNVDNRHKEIDPAVTVATMLMGTSRLYRFADRNAAIQIRRLGMGRGKTGCADDSYAEVTSLRKAPTVSDRAKGFSP